MFKIVGFIRRNKPMVLQVSGVKLMGVISFVVIKIQKFKVIVKLFGFRVA